MKKMTPAGLLMIILLTFSSCATAPTAMPPGKIAVLDPAYEEERLAADTALPGVNGAAIGADGHLYVTHTGNSTITRIDLTSMEPSLFVSPSTGVFIPDDIAADDKGNLYVTGTTPLVGEVYRIDSNGVPNAIADPAAYRIARGSVSRCEAASSIGVVNVTWSAERTSISSRPSTTAVVTTVAPPGRVPGLLLHVPSISMRMVFVPAITGSGAVLTSTTNLGAANSDSASVGSTSPGC